MNDKEILLGNDIERIAVPVETPKPKFTNYFTKSNIGRETQVDGTEIIKITMPSGEEKHILIDKDGKTIKAIPMNGLGNTDISMLDKVKAFALLNPKQTIAAGLFSLIVVGGSLMLIFSKPKKSKPTDNTTDLSGKPKSKPSKIIKKAIKRPIAKAYQRTKIKKIEL